MVLLTFTTIFLSNILIFLVLKKNFFWLRHYLDFSATENEDLTLSPLASRHTGIPVCPLLLIYLAQFWFDQYSVFIHYNSVNIWEYNNSTMIVYFSLQLLFSLELTIVLVLSFFFPSLFGWLLMNLSQIYLQPFMTSKHISVFCFYLMCLSFWRHLFLEPPSLFCSGLVHLWAFCPYCGITSSFLPGDSPWSDPWFCKSCVILIFCLFPCIAREHPLAVPW